MKRLKAFLGYLQHFSLKNLMWKSSQVIGRDAAVLSIEGLAGFWVITIEEMVQSAGRIPSSWPSNNAGFMNWNWGWDKWPELVSGIYWLHWMKTSAFDIPYRYKTKTICRASGPHHELLFHGFQYFIYQGQIGSKAMLCAERIWKICLEDSKIRKTFYFRNMDFRYNISSPT